MSLRNILLLAAIATNVAAQVDLTVTKVDASATLVDSQTLSITGVLNITVRNAGAVALSNTFRILVWEDRNRNSQFDAGTDAALGSAIGSPPIAAGASSVLPIAVSGMLLFRGNLIFAKVDSENAIAETNEANNILSTAGADLTATEPFSLTAALATNEPALGTAVYKRHLYLCTKEDIRVFDISQPTV